MSSLISLSDISKRHGAQDLFSGLSLSVQEGERMGIVGPNGAGKSTLLRVITGETDTDSGTVLRRKDLRVSYATQASNFPQGAYVSVLAKKAAETGSVFEAEQEKIIRNTFSALQIDFQESTVDNLSGGQRKRVQLALSLCEQPDLLLLDEPTNHLDIESILSLERLLERANFSWIVVSHDRWFLEGAVSRIVEVNRRYPGGLLLSEGGYRDFLEYKEEAIASLDKQRQTLENVVRNEIAWLRQGAKARSTKSKHRIDKVFSLMDSLSLVRAKNNIGTVKLAFDASDRKTKRLIELENVAKRFGEKRIVDSCSITIVSGQALGLLGLNGSGKTTFAKMLTGDLLPDSGEIKRASGLTTTHFTQLEKDIPPQTPLKRVLCEEGDSVVYRGNATHVASWAQRFRFSFEQLSQPYGSLSGGERARSRIARLMLEQPDVLILDEPTNDLDLETLEVLEQSLLEFTGALVLVTHDRFMINRLCTVFLGLDGEGGAKVYADYEQWERDVLLPAREKQTPAKSELPRGKAAKKRLGYMEQREFDCIEETIQAAEAEVVRLEALLAAPVTQSDPEKLQTICEQLDQGQKRVSDLYARWAQLEAKQAG